MNGLYLTQMNQGIISEAIARGLEVTQGSRPRIAYDSTLIVGSGVAIPWDLLDAGWGFLERWEAAAPLWRYGVLAADVGTDEERERTKALTLDLRVPLRAPELLFLRRCDAAEALLSAWVEESVGDAEPRLAFLRALCRVKPQFLDLPRSWLREVTP